MPALEGLGRLLLVVGLVMAGLGLLMMLLGRLPGGLPGGIGRLPGDIYIQRGNFSFYFPLATMLLLSLALTVILNIIAGLFRR